MESFDELVAARLPALLRYAAVGVLNLAEITKRSWTDAGSFTDNHRPASRRATKEREQFEQLIEQICAGKGDVLVVCEIFHKERDLAAFEYEQRAADAGIPAMLQGTHRRPGRDGVARVLRAG